jgi:hypothetical protein
MPSLRLNIGLSGGRKLPFGGGGGAGFPNVASTNQISVTSVTGTLFGVPNNGIGTYTKNGPINENLPTYSPYYAFDTSSLAGVGFRDGQWYLFYYNDDPFEHAVNASSNPTTIPTTGWVLPITITAA